MQRVVEPEILDGLAVDDPQALRSRADLRFINRMMGGERWILRALADFPNCTRVVELGAGEGRLANRIKRVLPGLEVVALDLHPRPVGVRSDVCWQQGDVMDAAGSYGRETVVVANLFLHHFERDGLARIGECFAGVGGWVCHEPHRTASALFWGRVLCPFVGRVTRHDMLVSIRAGFVPGELGELVGGGDRWEEDVSLFGSLRSKLVCL